MQFNYNNDYPPPDRPVHDPDTFPGAVINQCLDYNTNIIIGRTPTGERITQTARVIVPTLRTSSLDDDPYIEPKFSESDNIEMKRRWFS